MEYCKVFPKPKKEELLLRFHSWVSSGAIQSVEGDPKESNSVKVYRTNQRSLAISYYQVDSITIRVLSFTLIAVDDTLWTKRIHIAYELRKTLRLAGVENNNTFRLIHGEDGNLPGLVIDTYVHATIMQTYSVGIHYARHQTTGTSKMVLGDILQDIYYRSEAILLYKADLGSEGGYLFGGKAEGVAIENRLKFCIDW